MGKQKIRGKETSDTSLQMICIYQIELTVIRIFSFLYVFSSLCVLIIYLFGSDSKISPCLVSSKSDAEKHEMHADRVPLIPCARQLVPVTTLYRHVVNVIIIAVPAPTSGR